MLHPINQSRPDSFVLGLKLIGEALIDGLTGLGNRTVDTPWSKARAERLADCCR